ncbi:MAG: HAMP domain-containing protein [Lachnospiraceae bacterium]|nr:HAMP domain-containing protein [Lachnospiraceae bacterium]
MNNTKKVKTSISTKLLRILVPLVAVSIICIIVFLSMKSQSIITSTTRSSLENDSEKNAATVGSEITSLLTGFDQNIDTLEFFYFDDDDVMAEYLVPTMSRSEMAANGVYGGLSDGTWIDPSGWTPDADYVITERDWYIQGKDSKEFVLGEPYVDSDTGSLVVTASRSVSLADGRKGVMAVDLSLKGIVESTTEYKPMDIGTTMLFHKDFILSYYMPDYNGSKISDHSDDPFLKGLQPLLTAGTTGFKEMGEGNDTYYVVLSAVPGTPWTMVSSVNKNDVMKDFNSFQMICWIIMVAAVVVIIIVMLVLTRRYITRPVKELTGNIERITAGDFTVDIHSAGNDEIGVMHACIKDYVESMRSTLGNMQVVTNKLSGEARSSQDVSGNLNRQAITQSKSMSMIRDTMGGISDSVTELAENATTLAGAVSDLTAKGNEASETMRSLIVQADQGQNDMEKLRDNMAQVSESMADMNNVVVSVDESAKKINTIVEMINSISSQTNLLSLNASIEAARAGEAGRGFAVVAGEIGNLANESANATTEIASIISDITSQIGSLSEKSKVNMEEIAQGAEAVSTAGETFAVIFKNLNETGHTVEDMISMMNDVNEIAASVAAISEQQSASTIEVTDTVDRVVESAVEVASGSQNVDNSAQTVAESATKIEDFVNAFKLE